MKKIILASMSPRRRELMKKLGVKFKVADSGYQENMKLKLRPDKLVKFLAEGKARAILGKYRSAIIIGADTVVALKGKVLGKPKDAKHAKKMLRGLSGRRHEVFTGFAVLEAGTGKLIAKAVKTEVYFKKISDDEILDYIASGEPLDKAGAYAIQGGAAKFIRKIEGDYDNVVGLPVEELRKTLMQFKD